ncbi:MAG: glycosyltransferase [Bacteroidota bacterium]|nr:glycosyltransferase [Bacteroidota bacterium]
MPTPQNIPLSPLISFVVTTYNLSADMLMECLNSIFSLSLSREEREIILIDDGSDLSPLDEMTDVRDELIYLRQPNQGLSVARNMGLRCASGKYVQFIDGDDYLIQAPYEHCLDIIRYREADMVLFYETQKKQSEVSFFYDGPVSGVAYMHQNNLRASACGYIFRRAILGSLRFTPGILHEDEEFTPQLMLRAEKVYTTKAEAYFYRKRENSIMERQDNRHTAKRLNDMIGIILHLKDLAEVAPEIDRVALGRRIAQLSMDYLYNTIRLTRSHKHLMEAIETLRKHGLFPLPDKRYTKRYFTFRRLVGNALGRRILLATIR